MGIKIVKDGPEIVMTESEYLRAMREYQRCTSYMVDPPTFEEWVRQNHSHTASAHQWFIERELQR